MDELDGLGVSASKRVCGARVPNRPDCKRENWVAATMRWSLRGFEGRERWREWFGVR